MGRQPRDTSANPAFGSIGLCLEAQVKTSDSLLRVIQILRPWTVWIRYLLSHSWANKEILPKIKPKKLVKLTGHTNVYNSLSNFQYELWSTHNNRKRKLWESLETFVKSNCVNIVFGGFGPIGTTVYCHHGFAAKNILYLLILVVF